MYYLQVLERLYILLKEGVASKETIYYKILERHTVWRTIDLRKYIRSLAIFSASVGANSQY